MEDAAKIKNENVLLEIRDLRTTFYDRDRKIEAVRGVNLKVNAGEILGIVGESGSGKSVMMRSIMGMLSQNAKIDKGEIILCGSHLEKLPEREKRMIRGREIAMIFQDPMTALDPLKKIGYHIEEVLIRNKHMSRAAARENAISFLKMVGIPSPEKRINQYPHELSGGMRQRVMIAMALSSSPKLLIADEPTTALDVTIQAQILELLKKLKDENNMSVILISHDLGVVASLCSRIAVMYAGMIMEEGTADEIFYSPRHPYTKALLDSIPSIDIDAVKRLKPIRGNAPSLIDPPNGCPFAERCDIAEDRCKSSMPEYKSFSPTHRCMCFLADKGVKCDV